MAEGRDKPQSSPATPGGGPKPGEARAASDARGERKPSEATERAAEARAAPNPDRPSSPTPRPAAGQAKSPGSRPKDDGIEPASSPAVSRPPAGDARDSRPGRDSESRRGEPQGPAGRGPGTASARGTSSDPDPSSGPSPSRDVERRASADASTASTAGGASTPAGKGGTSSSPPAAPDRRPSDPRGSGPLAAVGEEESGRTGTRTDEAGAGIQSAGRGSGSPPGGPPSFAEPQRTGGGLFAGIIGGLIGAAIVGVGGWYFILRDRLPTDLAARVQALEPLRDRVAAVDSQAAVLKTRIDATAQDFGALQSRTGQLEQATRDLPGRVGALEQRLTQEQAAIAGVKSAGDAGLAELRNRLGAIDDLAGKVGAAQQRISGIEQATQGLSGKLAGVGDLAQKQVAGAQRLDQLQGQVQALGGLSDRVTTVASDTGAQLQALGSQVASIAQGQLAAAALRAQLDDLRSTTDKNGAAVMATQAAVTGLQASTVVAIDQTQAGVARSLQALQAKLESDAAARERLLALSLTTQKLSGAIERGEPLKDGIANLRELAADDPGLTGIVGKLEPLAAGVPTVTELTQSLPPPPTSAPAPQGGNASWLSQAGRNLTGLVSVAPAGQPVGPLGDRLDQARTALTAGDLGPAIDAVQALARNGEQKAKDWVERAQRRQTAVTAVHDLETRVQTLATARS